MNKIQRIISLVSEYTGIPVAEITGKRKPGHVVQVRLQCIYILHKVFIVRKYILTSVFSYRDNSSIPYAIKTVSNDMETDKVYHEDICQMAWHVWQEVNK